MARDFGDRRLGDLEPVGLAQVRGGDVNVAPMFTPAGAGEGETAGRRYAEWLRSQVNEERGGTSSCDLLQEISTGICADCEVDPVNKGWPCRWGIGTNRRKSH